MRRALSVIVAVTSLAIATFCPRARADSGKRVLVIGAPSTPVPAGLIEALRIQLGQSADVVSLSEPNASSASEEADSAERQQRATAALLVLWIDDTSGPPRLRALTASIPGARLELGPVEPISAERDRVLALKVEELLERELEQSKRNADSSMPRLQGPRTRAFVALGLRAWQGGSPSQFVTAPALAIGPRWEWPGVLLEAHGSFVFDRELHARTPAGQVDVSASFVGLGARALWRVAPLSLGPYVEAGMDVLRARGVAPDKRHGERELVSPSAAMGCELGLRLTPHFELRANAGPEVLFVHERLQLQGRQVLDVGVLRASGTLSALFVFP